MTTPRADAKPKPVAPPGSFLVRPAHTVPQIVQQVQADRAVRRRFARHYHISEREVIGSFSHGLQPGTLHRSGSYTVYFVTDTGLIYPTRMELHAGTHVFVGRNGHLMLLSGTGNPLIPFATATDDDLVPPKSASPPVTPREQIVPTNSPDIVTPAPSGSAPPDAAPPAPSPASPAPAVPVPSGVKP